MPALLRIVRLDLRPDKTELFLTLFQETYPRLLEQDGCNEVRLYRDEKLPNVYYTYSLWQSAEKLDAYRGSELFGSFWPQLKKWFQTPAQAYSLQAVETLTPPENAQLWVD